MNLGKVIKLISKFTKDIGEIQSQYEKISCILYTTDEHLENEIYKNPLKISLRI